MKVAVVGSGGREHAIIKKLMQSENISELIATPGNGGIASDVRCVAPKGNDVAHLVDVCVKEKTDYVVVAPDNILAQGMVDELAKHNILAFGPNKAAALIEASKVYAKEFMQKYNIPTAKYRKFDDLDEAFKYVEKEAVFPIVIKADGLALGKGVAICENLAKANEALISMMRKLKFGSSGKQVVIEEFLQGPEVSVLAFCDGKTLVPMVSSMDHKRVFDDDEGENTGGMGAVAPNPFYTEKIADDCMKNIFLPTVKGLAKQGREFKGCLYFGLILCTDGPKVIEYNCRFGDPETQVVLPLLENDLFEIMQRCTKGTLAKCTVNFKKEAAACVVLASGGYPAKFNKGEEINGIEAAQQNGAEIYCAGVAQNENKFFTNGGRVLGVTSTAATLQNAVSKAYEACEKISFKNMHYRKDIGKKAVDEILKVRQA